MRRAGDLPIAKAEFMSTAEKGTKGKEGLSSHLLVPSGLADGAPFFHTLLLIGSNPVLWMKKLKHKMVDSFTLKLALDMVSKCNLSIDLPDLVLSGIIALCCNIHATFPKEFCRAE